MILAAGRGERMKPLTDATPKPLLRVAGRALIDYHIDALLAVGIRELVINLSWLGELIRAHLGSGSERGISITYSEEGHPPLETGGGVLRALPLLGEPTFWLVNGDIFCDYPFQARTLGDEIIAHLVLVANPDHNLAGDFSLEDGLVRNSSANPLTYSGIALIHPKLLAGCVPGRFPLAPLLRAAAAAGRVSGEYHAGTWSDVGTPERLRALNLRGRPDQIA